MKKVKIKNTLTPIIVNTGKAQPLVDVDFVAKALGAEIVDFEDLSPRSQAIVRSARRGRRRR